jgi:hypothetical protein
MDQAAAMISMKQRGTYDPRKDPGSQFNRTGTATKEEKRWIKYQDGGRQGKSPHEIMNPILAPGSTIITKTTSIPLSDIESVRLEKLKKYREKLRIFDGSKRESNIQMFDKVYSDESLEKIAQHADEMTVGIDVYNIKDKQRYELIRNSLPPEQRSLFDQSPQAFIDGRIRYQGTWVPKDVRSREERRHAERRKELERELPDIISWWLPVRMKDDGDFESTFSIERRSDGTFNFKDLHNSQGGAWHSGKYLAEQRVLDDYIKKDSFSTDAELKKELRKEIVGVIEVSNTRKGKRNIEQMYDHLKPGESKHIPVTLEVNKNMFKLGQIVTKEENRFQPVSIRIGQLKPADIKKNIDFQQMKKLRSKTG